MRKPHALSNDPAERRGGAVAGKGREREEQRGHELLAPAVPSLISPEARILPGASSAGAAGARVQRTSLPELFGAMMTPQDRAQAGGLIVEDEARAVTRGQMRRGEFMRQLRFEVCRVAEEELRRAGRDSRNCPYIDRMLAYYEGRSAEQLERSIRRYAPETRRMRDARDYLPVLSQRLGRGIARWATTGRMPDDVPNDALAAMAGASGGLIGVIAGLAGLGGPMRKRAGSGAESAQVDAGALLRRLGPGQPLDATSEGRMGRALGHSFAGVRVHAGEEAAELNRDLSARAFTLGPHVAFGAGELRPGTPSGDALLAHELAHVIQQGSAVPAGAVPVGETGDAFERDADIAAAAAVRQLHGAERQRERAPQPRAGAGLRLQRCNDPPRPDASHGVGRGVGAANPGDAIIGRTGDLMHPADCHSYEQWLEQFPNIQTFRASSGHLVLGGGAAPRATATDATADPSLRRPTMLHGGQPYRDADRFIDGPTDAWVRANLPAYLVEVAYQLPSDCADIAVILRHVWLAAHGRSETYQGWQCGAQLAETRSRSMQTLLTGEVWTGSVERIVRPYTDAAGNKIRSFRQLEPLLHAGDVLVWKHNTPGATGHTHTIMRVDRDPTSGSITGLSLLQGNQPIGEAQAQRIAPRDENRQRELRNAPGRRIERSDYSGADLQDTGGVWTWTDGTTTLVAAGPAVAASVSATSRGARISGLRSWIGQIRAAADHSELQSRFEAALLDTRSLLETRGDPQPAAAEDFGRAVGGRLWELAQSTARARPQTAANALRQRQRRRDDVPSDAELMAEDLGEWSHYRPLTHMLGMLTALGNAARGGAATRDLFTRIRQALEPAARGIGGIGFNRPTASAGTEIANVLVTGFDPFAFNDRQQQIAPAHGHFNPSGAAVLQLDGELVPVSAGQAAAVEGVVLPVDYAAFRAGMVESMLRSHSSELDAVLTVSQDSSIGPADPLQVERFAVGVHRLNDQRLETIPGAGTTAQTAPGLIEARGAEGIGAESGLSAQQLREDRDVTLHFASVAAADNALRALGLPERRRDTVTINDLTALRAIAGSMSASGAAGISFRVGQQSFEAQVQEGPGGSFLSNEVSFRVLRFLAAGGGRQGAASFHVHTGGGTGGDPIPEPVGTQPQRTQRLAALDLARGAITKLVTTLRALIVGVARRILARRPRASRRP